ncbi:MAG TPA: plasmid pRiA4b ORF-3 family protein [Bacteroidetes bacterium]|nr:plasmid pRiA4b ORF-3 family protein [Bacteroidota bacterium]
MKKKFEKVYQFRIDLRDTKPPIWRRIQVPGTYTFWDLHVAIQDAMGWTDSHLHEFEIEDPTDGGKVRIGIPNEDYGDEVIPDWKRNISNFFSEKNPKAWYIYDFGDSWEHMIVLEKILVKEKDADYPRCIDGKRACPPEDCGGVWGYEEFLRAIRNPKHKEHKEMLEWIGGEFDSEHFDVKEVKFIDPDKHRRDALG